jgi:hypothetical protein
MSVTHSKTYELMSFAKDNPGNTLSDTLLKTFKTWGSSVPTSPR